MVHGDRDPEFIGQDLQFPLPQTQAIAVATTAVGINQKPLGSGVAGGAEHLPPTPYARDRKRGGVVADAEVDQSIIGGDVVDAIRCNFAEFRDDEVMHPDRLGLSLWAQLAAAILEVADKLLLLGIDRNDRIAGSLERLDLGIDVLELGVTIGMARAFARLRIGLQAETQTLQEATNQLLARPEAQFAQRPRQMALALAHPQQGRFRIAADRGLHQVIQAFQKPRLCLGRRLAATTPSPNSRARHHRARAQVCQATIDRASRNARRPRYGNYPAVSGCSRLTGREQPPPFLVQNRLKRFEASFDGSDVNHPARISAPAVISRQIPDSFVAFLSGPRFFSFDSVALAQALMRALDRSLPVSRVSYDTFRDIPTGDIVGIDEVISRYRKVLLSDSDFREQIGEYEPALLEGVDAKLNCVFIETQRLLQSKKVTHSDGETNSIAQEEILRQADYLASLLQKTYASYAATSQDLDRSFPNRLVSRSERSKSYDIAGLKSDLEAIEARRAALTEAGILVDTAEPLVAPKDEFIRNVSDALEIYVEDSKKKLSTFDDVFSRVSAFRDLMSKKLKPKILDIGREFGARVRREKNGVGLDKLSSGEKHEFIMLFRLIFETPPQSVVLIDEPEISLHVSWQLEFMSDLARIQSANSFQSIIATHSPQIIQGVEDITFDLSEQVK